MDGNWAAQEHSAARSNDAVKPRLFFLHIMKTGGTTLSAWLEQSYRTSDIRGEDLPDGLDDWNFGAPPTQPFNTDQMRATQKFYVSKLARLSLITNLHVTHQVYEILTALHPDYHCITVLREPVSRVLSHIEHWRRLPERSYAEVEPRQREMFDLAKRLSTRDLLLSNAPVVQALLHDHQAKMLAGGSYMGARPDVLLAAAKRNMARIAFVGTTERLDDLMTLMSLDLGLLPPGPKFALNARPEGPSTADQVDAETRALIEQFTKVDHQLWKLAHQRLQRDYAAKLHDIAVRSWTIRRERSTTWTSSVDFTMDDELPGIGWHEREAGAVHNARWIGPVPSATLYFNLEPRRSYRFEVSLISVINDSVLEETRIFVNDREVAFTVGTKGPYTLLTFKVPATLFREHEPTRLEFRSKRCYDAFSIAGYLDKRPKTLAVERVEIAAAA